jgi:hypothetical protein
MTSLEWQEVSGFESLDDYLRFKHWIEQQISDGKAHEVVVSKPYLDANTFHELWIQNQESQQVWRLIEPDAPFEGLFELVNI